MSQINLVYDTLKQCLREQRFTYKQIAQKLNVSEASVKRNFSLQAFSLDKLEQICECLNLSLSDLFSLSQKQQEKISQLSEKQEMELLANYKDIASVEVTPQQSPNDCNPTAVSFRSI